MSRLVKSTSGVSCTVSTPPPPIDAPVVIVTTNSVPILVNSGANSLEGSSSVGVSDPLVLPQASANIAPAVDGQLNPKNLELFRGFLTFLGNQQAQSTVLSPSVSSFAPVPAAERLIYTVAPSDRPFSAVGYSPGSSVPASLPVSGSGFEGVRGQQGRPLHNRANPSFYSARFPRVGRQVSRNYEGNRSWGAPSRGVFGEGAPAVVEGLDYLDQGEFYTSDPYYSHSDVRQPPFVQEFDTDFYPSFPTSAIPEEEVFDTGVIDNYRGVDTLAVDKEARSLLFKYMGDLYRDAPEDIGESSGAGSEQGEWSAAHSTGLFNVPRPASGINLPSEFANEFKRLESLNAPVNIPRGTESTFLVQEPEQSLMFGPKRLAPDTIAFAGSLRDPALSASKSPFESKEYRRGAFPWAFMSSTSSLNCRLAIYSAALADLLIRAGELEVTEEDAVTIRALILEVAAMQFAGAARMRLFALTQHRNLALDTMGLRDRLDVSAAVRTPKDGKYLFGGKLFEGVDTDLSMQKRVREVASRLAKPQRGDVFRRRMRPYTSFSTRDRGRSFRARRAGFSRSARGRGGAFGRGFGGPPSTFPSRK